MSNCKFKILSCNQRNMILMGKVKTADNRVIQDQLQQKICECRELQETITSLNLHLAQALDTKNSRLANAEPQHMQENEGVSSQDTAELLQHAHMQADLVQGCHKIVKSCFPLEQCSIS
ncbi:kinesin-like protein KIN-7D, chloroplastic [Asparagus officinalis]|uniref:kinesin-like protein KIN-7D, chloroplastic n=1 Tax=Asparagus officinalis TaxID=4686 RepID=UPI00098DE362|nr:kinesin-like protein KIN-7D, chloroplastic [Asparagus officinalis]